MKRRSVIAAICASAGVLQKAFGQAAIYGYAPVTWDIPKSVDDTSMPINIKCGSTNLCFGPGYEQKPVEFALIVRYDGREVKLTPKEIMDALEGIK